MIRAQIAELTCDPALRLSDDDAVCDDATIAWAEQLIRTLDRPATDEEATALLPLIARGDETSCYGLLDQLVHFMETAPGWPPTAALRDVDGVWPDLLRQRLINAGR